MTIAKCFSFVTSLCRRILAAVCSVYARCICLSVKSDEYVLNFVQVATRFDICGLKAMDMSSLAMIFFDLLNPNVYAYEEELSRTPTTISYEAVILDTHSKKKLPAWNSEHKNERQCDWSFLRRVYDCLAKYNPWS